MKKIYIVLILPVLFFMDMHPIFAQETTLPAGTEASGSGGTVSYSVGQIIYNQIDASGGTINQGVQQPYQVISVGIDNYKNITLSCFPNPAITTLTLKVEDLNLENVRIELYNIQGTLVLSKKIIQSETALPLEEFAAATYYLKIFSNNTETKTFKIIKQ